MNPNGDPNQMFKERFSNINTAKAQIERQREFDASKEKLSKEFNEIDINRDGLVSIEELQDFLDKKVRYISLIKLNDVVKRWKI